MRFFIAAVSAALFAILAAPVSAAEGETIFAQQCAACHGRKGEGMQYVAPSLKGSEFVSSASVDDIKAVVRAGRSGDAKKHPAFPAVMPPFPNLSEEELTAIAEYVHVSLQQ
ncbi:MAG: cytochrome c [Proteobacteria bacterium]|nr:cytochrome c [Pseudomonadota bacterium]